MKNIGELLEALVAGKRVGCIKWSNPNEYMCLKDGILVDEDDDVLSLKGILYGVCINDFYIWEGTIDANIKTVVEAVNRLMNGERFVHKEYLYDIPNNTIHFDMNSDTPFQWGQSPLVHFSSFRDWKKLR